MHFTRAFAARILIRANRKNVTRFFFIFLFFLLQRLYTYSDCPTIYIAFELKTSIICSPHLRRNKRTKKTCVIKPKGNCSTTCYRVSRIKRDDNLFAYYRPCGFNVYTCINLSVTLITTNNIRFFSILIALFATIQRLLILVYSSRHRWKYNSLKYIHLLYIDISVICNFKVTARN